MFKKILVFISIVILMTTMTSFFANADIINFAVENANDKRYSYVQEYPDLCSYMYTKYISAVNVYDPATGGYTYVPLYFATKETSLCKYPVPGKDGVYMSRVVAETNYTYNDEEKLFNGYKISTTYNDLLEPHNDLNKKLVQVLGVDSNVKYLLENDYTYAHENSGLFYKARVDIGTKTITVYFNQKLTNEQLSILRSDNIMNTSTIYIMCGTGVVIIVGLIFAIVYIKMKKKIYQNASYY